MRIRTAALLALLAASFAAQGAEPSPSNAPQPASVSVTGTATASVANDRMIASLRAETEAATAAAAAAEVNPRIAKAIAAAKAVAGVEVRSAGYSTWQVNERGKPARWRVTQSVAVEGSDFAAMAALVTKMQEDGLLLSGMSFGLRPETRRRTEDGLIRDAIKAWQARAEVAASALGFGGWRPGRVSVNTGEVVVRPEPLMRAQAMAAAPPIAPVAVEGGTTDITVTVTGDAVLDKTSGR